MNLPIHRLALVTATLFSVALTGCGIGKLAPSNPSEPVTISIGPIQGKAFGGNLPITGATIQLYAANTSGYGAASIPLISTSTAKYYPGGANTCVATADTAVSYSITSNVLTVTFPNPVTPALGQVIAGQSVTLSGFTTGTYLNGQTVVVTSVNATQFTAAFTHADVATQVDAGTVTSVCNSSVVTDQNGNFAITGDYSCTTGQQIYIESLGGNPGLTPSTTNNSAAGLLAVLGTCSSISSSTYVTINEVSTIAAAYALSGFATDATHVSDDEAVTGNTTAYIAKVGMANAFANAGNLVNLATGTALTTTGTVSVSALTASIVVPQSTINGIANILVPCVNSSGPTSSACSTLLSTATSDGTVTGTQPADTATAAINIAHHPAANVATLYGLIGGTANAFFLPSFSAQPNDFTISILFPQGGTGTLGIAIDGYGTTYATYGAGNTCYKITPASGVIAAGSGPASAANSMTSTGTTETSLATGSSSNPQKIAIDANNNVWIPNNGGTVTSNIVEWIAGNTSTTFGSVNTSSATQGNLTAVTLDQNDNLWAISSGSVLKANLLPYPNNSATAAMVTVTTPGTTRLAAVSPTTGNLAVAGAASSGNLYIFTDTGTSVGNATSGTGGLATSYGVISDASGNFWVANDGLSGSNTNAQTSVINGSTATTVSGAPYSITPPTVSGTQDVTAGLQSGEFDGVGNYFTGGGTKNGTTAVGAIYELSSTGAQIAAFVSPTAANQYFAVDPSGNLWYGGTSTIGEMIGVAAPKVTPQVVANFPGLMANPVVTGISSSYPNKVAIRP